MILEAYIDETGDRGNAGRASPIFGMAAVIVDPTVELAYRILLAKLRLEVNTPTSRPLSWKEDLKTHERRKRAAALFGGATAGVKVVYVCCDKGSVTGGYTKNTEIFYNYVAFYTLERILWVARDWPGATGVNVRFGSVKGFDHNVTQTYFDFQRGSGRYQLPWGLLKSCSWVPANRFDMSQVADVYAGFLRASLWPDEFGETEGMYLQRVWHQIHGAHACALGKGMKGMPSHEFMVRQPWWPCAGCAKAR